MALRMMIEQVKSAGNGIWSAEISPSELATIGTPASSSSNDRTILAIGAHTYSESDKVLSFVPSDAQVLISGRTSEALIVALGTKSGAEGQADFRLGYGDHEFLACLADMPLDVAVAGKDIIEGVRAASPGSLKPLGKGRFQEAPDNFWFIRVQPRDRSLVVTVRGYPEHFGKTSLDIKPDRRPYSRFKVRTIKEGTEAIQVILRAVRKRS